MTLLKIVRNNNQPKMDQVNSLLQVGLDDKRSPVDQTNDQLQADQDGKWLPVDQIGDQLQADQDGNLLLAYRINDPIYNASKRLKKVGWQSHFVYKLNANSFPFSDSLQALTKKILGLKHVAEKAELRKNRVGEFDYCKECPEEWLKKFESSVRICCEEEEEIDDDFHLRIFNTFLPKTKPTGFMTYAKRKN